jgi:hypothetical protein
MEVSKLNSGAIATRGTPVACFRTVFLFSKSKPRERHVVPKQRNVVTTQ